jgi:internalin A
VNLLKNSLPDEALYGPQLTAALDDVVIYGPVTTKRYGFDFPDTSSICSLIIEVMEIRNADGTEYFVEASLQTENGQERPEYIAEQRNYMYTALNDGGVLLPEDGLDISALPDGDSSRIDYVIYDMQHDPKLTRLTGQDLGTFDVVLNHDFLISNGGTPTVDMDSEIRTVTITDRESDLQGISLNIHSNLYNNEGSSYKIQVTGRVTTGDGPHDMFIRPISFEGETVGDPFVTSASDKNEEFTLTLQRTYSEIQSDTQNNILLYTIGGASQQNLEITGIVITETTSLIPSAEVKFLLKSDNDVLENGVLKINNIPPLLNAIKGGGPKTRVVTMQYMDTSDKAFDNEKFINRIRNRAWKQPTEGYQVTLKKRTDIGDVNFFSYKEAVENANAEGFESWPKGIDWNHDGSAKLSLTHEYSTNKQETLTLPNTEESRQLLKDGLSAARYLDVYNPELTDSFNDVVRYGSVGFTRYEFEKFQIKEPNFNKTYAFDLRVEVMPVLNEEMNGIEYIVEVSIETEYMSFDTIASIRTELRNMFEDYLFDGNTDSKTNTVLERYGPRDSVKIKGADYSTSLTSLDLNNQNLTNADIIPLRFMTNLKTLNINHNPITDLSPLKELENLTSLNLRYNPISDLYPLKELNKLTSLNLSCTQIYKPQSLDAIGALTSLRELDISDNGITNISALSGLKNLTNLNLSDNDIEILEPLSGLTNLTELKLYNNHPYNNLEHLENLTNLTLLDLRGNRRINLGQIDDLRSNIGNGCEILHDELPPAFANIGGVDYSTTLTTLDLSNKGLSDYNSDELRHMTNLHTLNLYGNSITDLTPLMGLENLRVLNLTDNPIYTDQVEALQRSLSDCSITHNAIEFIVIKGYRIRKDETELDLSKMNLKDADIQPLSQLTNLRYLWLNNNDISDITPLTGLTKLKYLNLRENTRNSDLWPLNGLRDLERLDLSENYITEVWPVSSLSNLKELYLGGNGISDVASLGVLSNLKKLELHNNQHISDITNFAGLKNLESLSLSNNNISDLSSLFQLTNLKSLSLYANPIDPLQLADLKIALPDCSIWP